MRARDSRCVAAVLIVTFCCTLIFPIGAFSASSMRVSFASPSEGISCSSSKVLVTALVDAEGGPVTLEFLVDGRLCQQARVSPSGNGRTEHSFVWDTRGLSSGTHTLVLAAKSGTGERASATMKVNLAGERGAGQVPLIQRPADGAVVSGRIEVRVQADAGEKGNVVLLVDGRLRAISNVPPFNFELDTDRMAEGLHTLQVQVHGHDGEIVSSPVSAFRVARSEPEPEVVVKSVRPAGELTLVSKAPKQSSEGLVAGSRDMQVSAQASLPRASGEVVSLAQQRQALSLRTASGVAAGKKVDSWRMELTAGPSRRTEEAVSVEIPKTTAGAEASISASEQYCRLPRAMQQLTSSVFPQRVKGQAVSLAPIAPAATEGCGTSLPMETESGIKPEAAASAPAGMEPERVVSEGIRLHIAKQGDCLWSLARRYGTTVTSIAEANGLKDINRIHVGQRLWIPTGPTLHVDGKPLTTEAGPFFHKGKLMIPLRAIVEACGGEVNWDAENHRVGLEIAGTRVILGIGESRALVNDQMIVLDGQVLLQANRTFIALDSLRELAVLPARFELEENRIEVARMTR